MISKNKLKYIKSLQIKKIRKQENAFLVEGAKSVLELLHSDFHTISLFLTDDFFNCYKAEITLKNIPFDICTPKELSEFGSFSTNNTAIAIARIKENTPVYASHEEWILLLDDIRDPGNLGTIIRVADWYGIKKIICSESTAEFYNPKVIAASMGSFTRVEIFYTSLEEYLIKNKTYVYGAKLEGENVHTLSFPTGGMILIGNESFGINPSLFPLIDASLHIPRLGGAESLNAAIATAIICDNIHRKI